VWVASFKDAELSMFVMIASLPCKAGPRTPLHARSSSAQPTEPNSVVTQFWGFPLN